MAVPTRVGTAPEPSPQLSWQLTEPVLGVTFQVSVWFVSAGCGVVDVAVGVTPADAWEAPARIAPAAPAAGSSHRTAERIAAPRGPHDDKTPTTAGGYRQPVENS
jgi:hypothetical protein